MISGNRVAFAFCISCALLLTGFLIFNPGQLRAETPGGDNGASQTPPNTGQPAPVCEPSTLGSPYIPVDSWIYPAILRLYGMGYVDMVYLGMRPWTRAIVGKMIEEASTRIEDEQDAPTSTTERAKEIYDAIDHELQADIQGPCGTHKGTGRLESAYTIFRGVSGTPLNDSFHLGQTVINDYGRPYENGINNYTGASGYATAGRFAAYVRGEFQYASSGTGYSPALAQTLAQVDGTYYVDPVTHLPVYTFPLATIPLGPISSTTQGNLLEAYVSAQALGHVFSFGRQDQWLGPGMGGAFAYSNNAENIYSFQINRIEPLRIKWLSYITGPFRYVFIIGPLRGHTLIPNPLYPGPGQPNVTTPGDPWTHLEKISFRPTPNLEFGFQRTVIWGGKGHGPITLHTFLKSFFSVSSPTNGDKLGREDPGARFGAFDFSYRLPFVRRWLTLYSDGEVHDDISPIDAPRHAAWNPGLYLSHVPGVPRLDVRTEAVWSDPPGAPPGSAGHYMYWEFIQRQGYTNNGQIFGHWIGRDAWGAQAWITYHLSGNEWIQLGYRNQKAAKAFIPGGTTLNDVNIQAVKRIGKDFEINGNFAWEHWKAPIYMTGQQTVTTTTIKLTWYPERKVSF
jgi:hypothetical protein